MPEVNNDIEVTEKKTRAPRKPTPKSAAVALRKASETFNTALDLARDQGLEFEIECDEGKIELGDITLVETF